MLDTRFTNEESCPRPAELEPDVVVLESRLDLAGPRAEHLDTRDGETDLLVRPYDIVSERTRPQRGDEHGVVARRLPRSRHTRTANPPR